ncbi:MAG: hypothetical protein ACRDRV_17370 [Pseudonocardiaceae bacterium]
MRTRTIGSGILLGLAAATLWAPAALAAPTTESTESTESAQVTAAPPDGAEVFITADGSPQAGENIEVVVRCPGEVGQPESPVLEIGDLQEVDSPSGIPTYSAPATINADTEPGEYPLTATCDGETLSNTFTVQQPDSPYPPPEPSIHIAADGSPQPGEPVEVFVRCDGEVGNPDSPVLEIGDLQEVDTPAGIRTYRAPATIDADTEPGAYAVTATCDGETLSWTFTVYPGDPKDGDPKDGDRDKADHRQVTRTPHGAPETGAGPEADHAALLFGAAGLAGLAGLGGLGAVVARRLRH